MASRMLDRAFRAQGFRLTQPRRAILQVVATTAAHLPVAELHRRAARIAPGIGLASVYRTIDLLDRLGLVKRVHVDHRHRHYAHVMEAHGHHLVCNGCGRVVEFSDCRVEGLARALARRTHFLIEGHSMELYGRCPDCRPSRHRARRPAAPRKQPTAEARYAKP